MCGGQVSRLVAVLKRAVLNYVSNVWRLQASHQARRVRQAEPSQPTLSLMIRIDCDACLVVALFRPPGADTACCRGKLVFSDDLEPQAQDYTRKTIGRPK